MKRLLLLALLVACSKPAAEIPPDTREAKEVKYVGAPELQVHKWAKEDSEVIAKFLNGESVSVISHKGEWAEIRTGGGTGWAKTADLADSPDAEPTPRFKHIPSPVTRPGAKGTVYIEATVNQEGDVTSTKVITNTTGSAELAVKNAAALEKAKFYPIVVKGERKPFIYYYRVDY